MSELETLEEHEKRFWLDRLALFQPSCGVACPECGAELRRRGGELLLSHPPQSSVFCKECGWQGSMH